MLACPWTELDAVGHQLGTEVGVGNGSWEAWERAQDVAVHWADDPASIIAKQGGIEE